MNAEKFVKKEAKKMLSPNWVIAILSTMELLLVPIISLFIIFIAYSIFDSEDKGLIENVSGSPVNIALFVVFHLAAVLALILLSPAYTGFVRIFSGIADGKNIDPNELFYFFDNKSRYKSAVKFMTNLIVKSFGIIVLCNIVGIMLVSMSGTDTAENISAGFGIAFLIVGTVIAFLIIHRFAFSVMLFSYYDYDSENAVSFGAKVAKGNTQKLINLTASFVPWLLFTFLVVPSIYVYPYMTCSYFVSAKYLIEQYKEQFGDIANSYADQNYKLDLGMTNIPQADKVRTTVTQIPPITEDRSRTSHFANVGNSVLQETIKKATADTEVLDKPKYDLENFSEKNVSISLEKDRAVDSL